MQDLVAQLDQHASLTDATERSIVETNATRSVPVFQRLGALLVDFGRAITAAQAAPVVRIFALYLYKTFVVPKKEDINL